MSFSPFWGGGDFGVKVERVFFFFENEGRSYGLMIGVRSYFGIMNFSSY